MLHYHYYSVEIITMLLLTIVLAVSHYVSPYLARIPGLDPKRITSFAGGVAVGYVFLHMLPEIVESHDKIHDLLAQSTGMSQFKDLAVFVIALMGFEVFYLLDRLTFQKSISNQNAAYRLSLGFYFVYNFLITYTLVLRVDAGVFYAILFTVAMSLHFILSDKHFQRYYPQLFSKGSRLFLVLGLLLGTMAAFATPENIYVGAMLTAFLSGAILYNAFSEEINLERQTSMVFFFLGTAIMAILLAVELLD